MEQHGRGWSLRAVARAAGLSLGSVRNLMRAELGLLGGDILGPTDALCVRVLAELGANRSTNRSASLDARTAALLERDRTAVALLREAAEAGTLSPELRLLVREDRCWLVRKDVEVLTALDEDPDGALRILPVGRWATTITDPGTQAAA